MQIWNQKSARLLGRTKSTISTEMNKLNGQYSADNAQKRAKNAKSRSHKPRKFANEKLQHFVIRKLKDGWSPEMIVHVLNNLKYETKISDTCVYNFINRRIELKKNVQDADISGMGPQKRLFLSVLV